jgi:CubicO group peptidase (beta-lactamase class C family)
VSIAVLDADEVTYAHFGADDATVYEIGSITKTFTSLLLADAIARGEVTANTKAGALLPLEGSPAGDVTLAELASHRSGLPRSAPTSIKGEFLFLLSRDRDPYVEDADGVIAQARAATLSGRGTVGYSNLGAAVLGQALAAASHMNYEQLLQTRLFDPLRMVSSSIPTTRDRLPDGALTGYSGDGKHSPAWTLNGTAPAGGIRSTVADMTLYARALLDGSAPGMDALTPRWPDGNGFGHASQIGYGWYTSEVGGRIVTSHSGATGGFAATIAIDRENQRAVIILSNTKVSVDHAALTLLVGSHQ